jgi:PKD repeat protein
MHRYLCLWLAILIIGMFTCLGDGSDINISEFNGSEMIPYTTYQNETPYQFDISGNDIQKIINMKIEPVKVQFQTQEIITEGPITIKQVCDVYDNLTKNWKYNSDMRSGESYGDYFQYANHSIGLAKNGWTGGGDCDDYAILMASMLESIGMTTRIILAYGPKESHAYPEVYLGNSKKNKDTIYKIKRWIQIKYNLMNLRDVNTHEDYSTHEVWLNLDWGENPYKSARRYPGFKYFEGKTKNVEIYVKPNSTKTNLETSPMAQFSVQPSKKVNVTEPAIFNASICDEVDANEKYVWVFGDGNINSGNPEKARRVVHRFNSSGPFKVSLNVTNKKGISILNSIDMVVIGGPLQENRPIISLFVANPETIFPDETVRLEWNVENATNVTIDPGNRKVPFKGTLQETLSNTTIYTIKAVNPEGLSDVKNLQVLVIKRPPPPPNRPKAAFIYSPSKPMENETIMFDGSLGAGNITYYEWNFGDGTIKSGKIVEHVYDQSGTYPVTLLVIDENNLRDYSEAQSLTVSSSDPNALFSIQPEKPKVGDIIKFDSSSSRGSLGEDILSYVLDFGDNTLKGNKMVETHIFNKSGKYPVSLTVTDRKGLKDTYTKDISVEEMPPVALFSMYPKEAQAGSEVSFDGSLSKPGRRNIIRYEWDFGDRKPGTKGIAVNHTFQQSGSYLVKLTVFDEGNVVGNCSKWITIGQEVPPVSPIALSIESFTFTPNPVCMGDTTKISWKTSGATGVTITPGIGIVEPSGFRILSPKQTMGYTLRAWNTTTNTKPLTVLLRIEQCIEDFTPSQDQAEDVIYDFIEEAHDQGQWLAGPSDAIFRFGSRSEDDYRGSAMWKNDLQLNDMTVSSRVLIVSPPENGYVSGTYRHMNYMVQPGDRLIGRVGYFKGSEAGNVTFSLFLIDGNTYHHLWSRSLSYQDGSVGFDVPLGNYAGWWPAICLKVDSNGPSLQDKVVWQDVKIVGSLQRTALVSGSIAQRDFASSIFDNWNPSGTLRTSSSDIGSSAVDWLNRP